MLSGGNLCGEYRPTQLHFHWGSEHTIMGRRFPIQARIKAVICDRSTVWNILSLYI